MLQIRNHTFLSWLREKWDDFWAEYEYWKWERQCSPPLGALRHQDPGDAIKAIEELTRALEAGGYNVAPEILQQGSLHVEDLSATMQLVTFEDPHLKAWLASLPAWRRWWYHKKSRIFRWWWEFRDRWEEI